MQTRQADPDPTPSGTESDPPLAQAGGRLLDDEEDEGLQEWLEDRAHGICPPYTGRRRPRK